MTQTPSPRPVGRVVSVVAVVAVAAVVVLPVLGLLVRVPWSRLGEVAGDPLVREAAWISVRTSVVSTLVVVAVGLPLAWFMSSLSGRTERILRAVVTVPVVLPPVVGGIALLAVLGRRGLLGGLLEDVLGVTVPFTSTAVVIAQVFVSMPFFVLAAHAAFDRMDPGLVDAARTMGSGPVRTFLGVAVPVARPALVAGAALAWARALGEFGASITFAGSLGGRTQTVPMAVYALIERDPGAAMVLSALLLAVAFVVIVGTVRHRGEGGLR